MSTYERFILGQPTHSEKSNGTSTAGVVTTTTSFHAMSLLDRERKQLEKQSQQINLNKKTFNQSISSHAWNPNNIDVVALASTTSSNVHICSVVFSKKETSSENITLNILHTLTGYHATNMPILSLDWCCSCENSHHDDTTGGGQQENNGKIVTCGEDCKAFVWSYNKCKKSWVASQVFLQDHSLPLAPMCCQWNQTGDKILVGMNGGSKTACLTVCSFNNDLKEWTSLTIGSNSIKSAVLCVQWKPKTNKAQEDIVASGGCDFKCRVFSIGSMNLSIDSSAGDDGKERTRARGAGEQIAEFATIDRTWVTSVAWSPKNGNLAFSSHLSYVYVVVNPLAGLASKTSPSSIVFKLDGLSYTNSIVFMNDIVLYCTGYDGGLRKVVASCVDKNDGDVKEKTTSTSTSTNDEEAHLQYCHLENKQSWTSSAGKNITEVAPWKQTILFPPQTSKKTAGAGNSIHCITSTNSRPTKKNTNANSSGSSSRYDMTITSLKMFKRKQSPSSSSPPPPPAAQVKEEETTRKQQNYSGEEQEEEILISATGSFGLFKVYQTC